jgi:uncharacterized membrane protein YdbT with pleckstrin-like domain
MLNGDVGAGVFFAAFGAAVIALGLELRSATEMAVTSARVVAKAGLLRRKTVELSLSKVECVIVDQGLLGRMLGYGNVVIRGTGGTGEPFRTVRSPMEFRRQVQQCTQDHTTVRVAWLDARH